MAKKDVERKILEIVRELGIDPDEIESFDDFINAVYTAIVEKKRSEDLEEIEPIIKMVQQSRTLQEPFTAYMVLRMLEDSKYRKGFRDGLRVAQASHKSEVEKKASDIVTRILNIWENQLIPQMTKIFTAMNQMLQGRPQPQTPSIPVRFEEEQKEEENKGEGGISIEFGGEEGEEEGEKE